jgi:hypothetical protein
MSRGTLSPSKAGLKSGARGENITRVFEHLATAGPNKGRVLERSSSFLAASIDRQLNQSVQVGRTELKLR